MSGSPGWQANSAGLTLVLGEARDPLARQHEFLLGVASRTLAAAPLERVLTQVVEFVTSVVPCDSCFVYVLEGEELVLSASKNPHPEVVNRLKLKLGQGITGWVAQHRKPVMVPRSAAGDARFRVFNELPEDRYEAFLSVPLLSRGNVVGVINLQNVEPKEYSEREIALVSSVGFLVGAEIEIARLERENTSLANRLELRKVLERAKGILQTEMKISEQEAFTRLQQQSQISRRPMKEIAEAIVLTHSMLRGGGPETAAMGEASDVRQFS